MLLVSMPFGALDRPALGISLLKAQLARDGVDCRVRYFTNLFSEFVGYEDYQWVNSQLPHTAFAGDWCFTEALYGPRPSEDREYLREIFCTTWQQDELAVRRLLRVRAAVAPFLERCMADVAWRKFTLVGFTSTFEQNIASLALARRIKATCPRVAIVFGGANWEGDMGVELHRRFPFVDYACSGESERSLPELVRRLNARRPPSSADDAIAGVVHRCNGVSTLGAGSELIRDLDGLPVPDYREYFEQLNDSTVASSVMPNLLFESSRGCWWGAKSHCTFCGLNGNSMAFRSKSAERVLSELAYLVDTWRIDQIEVVDNILDMRYFNDVLPKLAAAEKSVHLFFETKANLSRRQVEILRSAGVHRIQPGIESLSDHVLSLMRKGTTGLRNVQLLKWCKEYGIIVDWNLLYGFPGETQEDYDTQLDLMRSIRFLDPPGACGSIRLDRFSPYFNDPESFGLRDLEPMKAYTYLYPFGDDARHGIAYYFDFRYQDDSPEELSSAVVRFADDWRCFPNLGTLQSSVDEDQSLVIVDTREDMGSGVSYVLTGLERMAYEYCDKLRSLRSVSRHLREQVGALDEASVAGFLDSLVANRLMVTDGSRYLSLALRADHGTEETAMTRLAVHGAG